ncbi:hypothetical protein BS50DRAFT_271608 [Corynespora cassiicola Philippines]|uniref:Uncharacterized protein n=1 Tax=Corynespora cassiicola Philippines TaxID=1448308 RepID=A0A2T2P074_CORCC|nr:hypothetical protein BS50DRAFT_271608 [Corynespora cassiicola Philippines]
MLGESFFGSGVFLAFLTPSCFCTLITFPPHTRHSFEQGVYGVHITRFHEWFMKMVRLVELSPFLFCALFFHSLVSSLDWDFPCSLMGVGRMEKGILSSRVPELEVHDMARPVYLSLPLPTRARDASARPIGKIISRTATFFPSLPFPKKTIPDNPIPIPHPARETKREKNDSQPLCRPPRHEKPKLAAPARALRAPDGPVRSAVRRGADVQVLGDEEVERGAGWADSRGRAVAVLWADTSILGGRVGGRGWGGDGGV